MSKHASNAFFVKLANSSSASDVVALHRRRGGVSTDTALRDIRELLDRGVLVQNPGGGRSTSYRLAEPENIVE